MTLASLPADHNAITYSLSITITLTHDCPWHCAYCGFRTDREGLLSEISLEKLLNQAHSDGAMEALLISGERPDALPHIRSELKARGFDDFVAFSIYVARRCLDHHLLPHGNFGALSETALARLRPHFASMGLMLENVQDYPAWAPEKRARGRLRTLETAGKLRIPFTTGILVGLGESTKSTFQSLEALAQIQRRWGHLQEILIQNYQPNLASPKLKSRHQPSLELYIQWISYWKTLCPEVPVQIPPNLNPYLDELWPYLDDLGGISRHRDEINPLNSWQEVEEYRRRARKYHRDLTPRLCVYPRFIEQPGWLDPQLRPFVEHMQHRLRQTENSLAKKFSSPALASSRPPELTAPPPPPQ